MYDVAKNLHEVLRDLPDGVKLVAISKFHPNEYIEVAYNEGQRIFGESQEQELSRKVDTLPKDIEWHFIGHLQTNKVKYIAPYISMIEAVDSLKLLKEINKQDEYPPLPQEEIIKRLCRKYQFVDLRCRSHQSGSWLLLPLQLKKVALKFTI